MKKRILSLVMAVALSAGLAVSAAAANENVTAAENRQIKVLYNGVEQSFTDANGNTVYPLSYNYTTYLPVRAMSGLMGLKIDYVADTNTVTIADGGTASQKTSPVHGANENVTVLLNRDLTITYNGVKQSFTDAKGAVVYPISYKNTTYLPVRAVCGLTGLAVDSADNTVILGENKTPVAPPAADISSDWTNLEFTLDGVKFSVPFAFKTLQAQGWTVDFSKYKDMDENYLLNPGDKVYGTIALSNSKYDKYFTFWIGFQNNASSAQKILDCDVWTVKLDTMHGFKQLDSFPKAVVAKGITWGASAADVLAAYGEPKEKYESTSTTSPKYTKFTYQVKYDKYFILTVYEDFGLTAVELKNQG